MNSIKLAKLAQREPRVRDFVKEYFKSQISKKHIFKNIQRMLWVMQSSSFLRKIAIPVFMRFLNGNSGAVSLFRRFLSPKMLQMLQMPALKFIGEDTIKDIITVQGGFGDEGTFGERAIYSVAVAFLISIVWASIYSGYVLVQEKDDIKNLYRQMKNVVSNPSTVDQVFNQNKQVVEKTMANSINPDGSLNEKSIVENMKRMV